MMEEEEDPTVAGVPALTPPPFCVDEKVYCKDKGRYYEATVRKTRYKNNAANNDGGSSTIINNSRWEFFLHYTGWNTRWDRWITADSLLKDTAENRALCHKQQEQENNPVANHNNNATAAAEGTSNINATTASATTTTSSGQKRSRSSADGGGPQRTSRKRLTTVRTNTAATTTATTTLLYSDYCELPLTLKTVLVDEYERLRRLVHVLPAPVPVRKVLNHFAKKKIKACKNGELQNVTADQIQEFVQGLTVLFQEALPVCLLYPQERLQYESLKDSTIGSSSECSLVDVYGCEYLLRLFVRLPILLHNSTSSLQKGTFFAAPTIIGPLLTDLLVLLQKNRQTLFPMSIGPTENANYRLPLPNEWMNWSDSSNNKGNNNDTKATPPSPIVEMDTK